MSGKSRASRCRQVRLWSWPLRNHPVLVGPQSVSISGPSGKPFSTRKRLSVAAVFHAPVET